MPAGAVVRKVLRLTQRVAIGLACLCAAFAITAVIGTFWLAPSRVADGDTNTRTVFVLSNGFHTDIALPVTGGVAPAGIPVRSADLARGLSNVRYIAVGWGSEAAYTRLLSITDLSFNTIAKALSFDRSVIHVVPFYGTPYGAGVYRIELNEGQYGRLIRFVGETFLTGSGGDGLLLDDVSQGYGDVFYQARPLFSIFYSCNAWTGDALRKAGVRVGAWTPFAQSLEWALDR